MLNQSAHIDALSQRNAVLTSAVETNERTIADMMRDAAVLAAANQKLASRIMAAEMEHVTAWQAIDELDLRSDTSDVTEFEGRINGEFERSISGLKAASGR